MKYLVINAWAFLVGALTAINGYPWFNSNGINIPGAFLNIVLVLFGTIVVYGIDDLIKGDK